MDTTETLPAADSQTADDLLIDRSNSRELGRNLDRTGEERKIGANGRVYDAHHMISPYHRRTQELITRLSERLGIPRDELVKFLDTDARNGVYLPRNEAGRAEGDPATLHKDTMKDKYFNDLRDQFDKVNDSKSFFEELSKFKEKLKNGQ